MRITKPFYDRFIPAPGHGLGFNDLKVIECRQLIGRILGEQSVGITFDVSGDGKTVIKANYGLFWHNPGVGTGGAEDVVHGRRQHEQRLEAQHDRDAGVPLALATDDEGVSRSSMTGELTRAVVTQGVDYLALKAMVRNSIEHAFVPGESLWQAPGSLVTTTAAGAEIVGKREELFERAQMIVKVKEPIEGDLQLLRQDHLLFCYLHLAALPELTRRLSPRTRHRLAAATAVAIMVESWPAAAIVAPPPSIAALRRPDLAAPIVELPLGIVARDHA